MGRVYKLHTLSHNCNITVTLMTKALLVPLRAALHLNTGGIDMDDLASIQTWQLASSIERDVAATPMADADTRRVLAALPNPSNIAPLQSAKDLMVAAMVLGKPETTAKADALLTRVYMDEMELGEFEAKEKVRKWKQQAAGAIEKIRGHSFSL